MTTSFEIIGVITRKGDVFEYTGKDKTYKSIDVTLEIGDRFKDYPTFTFSEFAFPKLKDVEKGDKVWVKFSLGGRVSTKADGSFSFFNKISGNSIGVIEKAKPEASTEELKSSYEEPFDVQGFAEPPADDLPF